MTEPNGPKPTEGAIDGVHRMPSTGISILIVGGGIGGLNMALESWRQGHDVRVLEKAPSLDPIGESSAPIPAQGTSKIRTANSLLQEIVSVSSHQHW